MKVFLDVDGVLIDGWNSDPARRNRWDEHMGRDLGIDRDAFQETFFASPPGGSNSLMHQCLRGQRDLKEALADVLPSLGYRGSVDAFVTYWFANDSKVNQDVLEIAKQLASTGRADLFLVTGQEHYRADHLWNELGFRRYFSDILYSARVGYLKSEPAFYQKINSILGTGPDDRPIYFDDHNPCVRLGREAGWDARLFTSPDDIRHHERLRNLLSN